MIKIPRAQKLTRDRLAQHMAALDRYPASLATYCRAQGVKINVLAAAIDAAAPLWFAGYLAAHPTTKSATCPNCGRKFYQSRANQNLCSRICGSQRRSDADYFGGKRQSAVGYAEGECQLCGRHDPAGLSVHHAIGKDHDPQNAHMVALCKGCHLVVGILANRTFVDEPGAWENLIAFVCLRRARGRVPGFVVDVEIVPLQTSQPQGELVHG